MSRTKIFFQVVQSLDAVRGSVDMGFIAQQYYQQLLVMCDEAIEKYCR